jgi:GT2 family glycosyltransferase
MMAPGDAAGGGDAPRVGVVVLTYNRRAEVLRTLARLELAARGLPVCVVDNGSADDTVEAIRAAHPGVQVVPLGRNAGAAARNVGVATLGTPYAAFCDDDTWWAPGSLAHGAMLLDRHPRLAAITARILVGPEESEDPTSTAMAASPLPSLPGVPGTAILGLLAGASIVRSAAFLAVGGYAPRYFLGGEEGLVALDLMAAGWQMAYVPSLVVHHHPSRVRDVRLRNHTLVRNALWTAWLRLPPALAWRESIRALRAAPDSRTALRALAAAIAAAGWVWRARRVVPRSVVDALALVRAPLPEAQRLRKLQIGETGRRLATAPRARAVGPVARVRPSARSSEEPPCPD